MYVVLEGIDTSGKSTQIQLLKVAYPQAIFTKEPGGSAIGEKIRDLILNQNNDYKMDPKTEFLLFLADRAEHIAKVILPHQNKLIISDRSLISGIAYANNIQEAKAFNLFATDQIIPDLAILLELQKETLVSRLDSKSSDTIESRGIEYLLKIQDNLKNTIHSLGIPSLIIDASKDKHTISKLIKEAIDSRLCDV